MINKNPAAFGLNTTVKSGLHWGQYANIMENKEKNESINKTFDSLDKLSYFLKQGKIEDYNLVYAEIASQMTDLFGFGNDAMWINEHTELLLDLLDNTENYEEALEAFRNQLLKESNFNLNNILSEGTETSWGEYIVETTEDVYELAAAFDKAGYSATVLDDGTIAVIDTFGKYLRNNFLSNQNDSNSKSDTEWENPYDRLHNLLEHITAVQKERNRLEREYNKLVREPGTSYKETQQVLQKRLENLHDEYQLQKRLMEERDADMRNYYNEHKSEIEGYAYYKGDRVYINWDALENSNLIISYIK